MKPTYVIYVLLGVMIGTLVLVDNGAAQTSADLNTFVKEPPNNTVPTTAVPPIITSETHSETTITTSKPSSTPTTHSTTITTATNTSTSSTTPSTTPTTPTTPIPTNTTVTSTTPSTTPTTTTPASKTTSHTTSPTPISTSTAGSKTTALPLTTPSPSKDRQFDGLSFFGGIILTTCLMAIAAFSWKFYRQCKEGNYRTL